MTPRDLVVEPLGWTQTRRAVVGPENPGNRLVFGPHRRGADPVTAEALHVVESDGILRARQVWRRWHAELVRCLQDERGDFPPEGAQREPRNRDLADRIGAPLPGLITRDKLDADARLGTPRAIHAPERQDRGGGLLPQRHPVCLGPSIRQLVEVGGEERVQAGPLRGIEDDQRIVRRLGDGGVQGGVGGCRTQVGIALVAAGDGVHRIEERDVDDRERAARPCGAKLLAEDPVLSGATGVWSSATAVSAISCQYRSRLVESAPGWRG